MAAQSVPVLQPKKEIELAGKKEDFFQHFQRLYDSIARRAFEIFEGTGRFFGNDLNDWFRAESELLHPVHIDVSDSGEALNVQAEVPGFTPRHLQIIVEARRLTIMGKRETKEERKTKKTVYKERCAGEILRVVELPAEINTEKVKATLENGVLSLDMPKAAPAKKIAVETKVA